MKKIIAIVITIGIIAVIAIRLVNVKSQLDEKKKPTQVEKDIVVDVELTKLSTLSEVLEYSGTFEPFREVNLTSETNGKITKLSFEEGDNVIIGKSLVQTDITILEANKETAEANFLKLEKDLNRTETLFKSKAATEVQLQDVKLAFKNAQSNLTIIKKQISNSNITAPFAGTISKKFVELGSVLAPGSPVCTITDISKLKLKVQVPEQDIIKYKNGDKIEIKTDAYGNKSFYGNVSSIGVKSNGAKMFPLEIILNNDAQKTLRAGMYAKTNIQKEIGKEVIVILRKSLVGSIKNPQVYVVDQNKSILKNITIGETVGEYVEVKSGLNVGEQVVTTGQINLENGTIVQINK